MSLWFWFYWYLNWFKEFDYFLFQFKKRNQITFQNYENAWEPINFGRFKYCGFIIIVEEDAWHKTIHSLLVTYANVIKIFQNCYYAKQQHQNISLEHLSAQLLVVAAKWIQSEWRSTSHIHTSSECISHPPSGSMV